MQLNTNSLNKTYNLPCLETNKGLLNSPDFQQGYKDAYTHQRQNSKNPEYVVGYLHGAKDRVCYRDC
ncbi:hypothetical protein NG798_02920 [Ancylothrix sp. C2]|uniref:hypothetical protein n=1 Tax=Ancylothrix sp. D3o TaxID=2953691 RepID=UPI0021BB286C|nr:hypothetical protein [Ancylothrix sp. D3o]MCT7948732.1 hypothetical protein [Ancylothrix sp. D3o]